MEYKLYKCKLSNISGSSNSNKSLNVPFVTIIIINSGTIIINNKKNKRGDVVILKPNKDYVIELISDEIISRYDVDVLVMDSQDIDFVSKYLDPYQGLNKEKITSLTSMDKEFFVIKSSTSIRKLLEYFFYSDKSNHELASSAFNISLLGICSEICIRDIRFLSYLNLYRNIDVYNKIIENIYLWINKGCYDANELYLKLDFDKEYVDKILKDNNTTLKKCLEKCRSVIAIREIINTTDSLSNIAFRNGYSSSSSFTKKIKGIYGYSPIEIRKIFNHNCVV
ncbi:helix-turn-helix domain-containing protein [Photobacterium damselae]|uniref:helix-turn-helix domain-containing protein n=1 Tax=Photobacterium damselae TaxID=38293 RepID=UPI0025431AAF